MSKPELIKGLGSYGNECAKARIQLPRPTEEKVRKGNKGEYEPVKVSTSL